MSASGVGTYKVVDLQKTISVSLDQTVEQAQPRIGFTTHMTPLNATRVEQKTLIKETLSERFDAEGTVVDQNLRDAHAVSSETLELSSTFGPSLFSGVATISSESVVVSSEAVGDEVSDDTYVERVNHAEGGGAQRQSSRISRFEVREVLGAGSFGEVLSAQDQDLNRRVAIKHYRGDLEMALKACRDEVRFLGRLEHPNIPTVYQASISSTGNPYIVMQQLVGESLQDVIDRLKAGDPQTHARYSFRYRITLIVQLLRILEHTHQARVLHRDIKPENIYIGEHRELYLIDWGIAEDFDIARDEPVLCGTPMYLSPEQGQAKPLNSTSDIYSVGAVAYELMCLASCAPPRESIEELLRELPTFKPHPVDKTFHPSQGYAPSEFKFTIMKAIARDPLERFQSASEMADDFERALDGQFRVICPRTLLKYSLVRFSRWIDRRLANVVMIYIALIALLLALVGFGVLIGYWLA